MRGIPVREIAADVMARAAADWPEIDDYELLMGLQFTDVSGERWFRSLRAAIIPADEHDVDLLAFHATSTPRLPADLKGPLRIPDRVPG